MTNSTQLVIRYTGPMPSDFTGDFLKDRFNDLQKIGKNYGVQIDIASLSTSFRGVEASIENRDNFRAFRGVVNRKWRGGFSMSKV